MLALRLTTRALWVQIVLALAYAAVFFALGSITNNGTLDGLIGGMLGLYICTYPARNMIDVLFANRFAARQIWSTGRGRRWVALNGLVLLAGSVVITLGMVSLIQV